MFCAGVLPSVCLPSISCVGAWASEDAPKSGSQVSSLGTVSAAIGVRKKTHWFLSFQADGNAR